MSIWPAAGATGASLKQALREVQSGAMNIFAGGTDAVALIENYLKWVSEAVRMLRLVMRPEDLDRLVLTSRYWATLANPASTPAVVAAVNDEVLARQFSLDAALKELDRQLAAWTPDPISGPVAYLVPDTNVLLHHAALLPDIDWHATVSDAVRTLDNLRVVIPLLVVDELDDAKRDRTRTRARQTLKLIYDRFGGDVKSRRLMRPASTSFAEVSLQLLLDPPQHSRLPRADDELVDRALAVQSFIGQPVDFVSYDTGAVLRARAAGLRPHRLQHA